MDMSLSTFREIVKDREAWPDVVHGTNSLKVTALFVTTPLLLIQGHPLGGHSKNFCPWANQGGNNQGRVMTLQ